jgi:hypothetical protein
MSQRTPMTPSEIRIEGGENNSVYGNIIISDIPAILIAGGKGNSASGNLILPAGAESLLLELLTRTALAGLPEHAQAGLNQEIEALKHSADKQTLLTRYNRVVGSLADHAQLLGPWVPDLLERIRHMLPT